MAWDLRPGPFPGGLPRPRPGPWGSHGRGTAFRPPLGALRPGRGRLPPLGWRAVRDPGVTRSRVGPSALIWGQPAPGRGGDEISPGPYGPGPGPRSPTHGRTGPGAWAQPKSAAGGGKKTRGRDQRDYRDTRDTGPRRRAEDRFLVSCSPCSPSGSLGPFTPTPSSAADRGPRIRPRSRGGCGCRRRTACWRRRHSGRARRRCARRGRRRCRWIEDLQVLPFQAEGAVLHHGDLGVGHWRLLSRMDPAVRRPSERQDSSPGAVNPRSARCAIQAARPRTPAMISRNSDDLRRNHPGRRPRPVRVWGLRLLKAAVVVLAAYFTYRFFTHSDFDWSKLAERVAAARAAVRGARGGAAPRPLLPSGTGATSWR